MKTKIEQNFKSKSVHYGIYFCICARFFNNLYADYMQEKNDEKL